MLEDESPYPEVRSAVANTDDPIMPASTLRAWVIGIIWAVLIPGVNQFFSFRYPSVSISPVCVPRLLACLYPVLSCTPCGQIIPLLLSFPIGEAWARYVPNVAFFGVELNPGPFTIKEHVIITTIASAGGSYAVSSKFSKQLIWVFSCHL